MRINRVALIDWREERGLTKTELARAAGISLSYLSEIESGLKEPSPAVIGRIANALKIRKGSLLADPEPVDEVVA